MDQVGEPLPSRIPLLAGLAAAPMLVILARWPHIPRIAFNPYDMLVWGRGPGTDLIACIALCLASKGAIRVWRQWRELFAHSD